MLQLGQRLALIGNEAGEVEGRQPIDSQPIGGQDRGVLASRFCLVFEAHINVPELSIGLDQIATGLDQLFDNDLILFLQYLEIQPAARARNGLEPMVALAGLILG
ncbi:hypothetical protein D3C73_1325130 [compost metagenome]